MNIDLMNLLVKKCSALANALLQQIQRERQNVTHTQKRFCGSIKFNNMLTNLKRNKNKSRKRHEAQTKWETYRDKEIFLRLEEPNAENSHIQQHSKDRKMGELFLPLIYKTENLIPHTGKAKMPSIDFGNVKQVHRLSINKFKRLASKKETFSQKQNGRTRILTDQREESRQCGQSRIYHNFVNKKKNKMTNHMSKIIDKVISENIEPWNLQNSSVFMQQGGSGKQAKKLGGGRPKDYYWQKYVLNDLNSMRR